MVQRRKAGRAPVNPLTGMPNTPDAQAAQSAAPVDAPVSTVDPSPAATPASVDPAVYIGKPNADAFLDKVRGLLDSLVVSSIVLAVLLLLLFNGGDLLVSLAIYLAGYVLISRFVVVRRIVTLGGAAWAFVLLLGVLVTRDLGPLFLSIDYFFMFCGFFLAIAVCGAFFAGRAMYHVGREHGRDQADAVIARHMVDRLVEHRDNWENLDGDFLEVEGAINRVRERERQSAGALRDEARRKDDLVTYLAHDLKTPLASVVGYLSLLEEAPDLPADQRVRFTRVALDKAHRLDALIEEFFDITRFDFHDIVLTRGYVDLALMLAQVADEFYPRLAEQGKTAQIDVPTGLTVLIDGDKMARVFNNVMKNAIAYSYEGTAIRVSAHRAEDGQVVVRFENQGDPIPEPKLKVIFEKFYRLDAARATNRGGAGLGLAIAKEIVTAHGGSIGCASTPEATVFTITLPAA